MAMEVPPTRTLWIPHGVPQHPSVAHQFVGSFVLFTGLDPRTDLEGKHWCYLFCYFIGFLYLPPFPPLFHPKPFQPPTLGKRERRLEGKGAWSSAGYFLLITNTGFHGEGLIVLVRISPTFCQTTTTRSSRRVAASPSGPLGFSHLYLLSAAAKILFLIVHRASHNHLLWSSLLSCTWD